MTETRTLRIEGIATALAPISHGDGVAGTVQLFHREKVVTADGVIAEIPAVTGNALRGLLRDHAATIMWRALGSPALDPHVFDLMWSGGQLTKGGSLSDRQLSQLRRVNPMVSLFGGSGAGKIIEGKLRVSRLMPICRETSHLTPDHPTELGARDLLQIMEFTRRDDAKRDQYHDAIAGLGANELPSADPTTGELLPSAGLTRDAPIQMRYGAEMLISGTRLTFGFQLLNVTDPEVDLFGQAIGAWTSDGAHIGGRAATGHGRLRLDVHQWTHETPVVTVGEALAVPGATGLDAHVAAYRDEILETFDWFA